MQKVGLGSAQGEQLYEKLTENLTEILITIKEEIHNIKEYKGYRKKHDLLFGHHFCLVRKS